MFTFPSLIDVVFEVFWTISALINLVYKKIIHIIEFFVALNS